MTLPSGRPRASVRFIGRSRGFLHNRALARYVIGMRAVFVTKPGGPELLEIRDAPRPAIKAGQLLVRNFAAALDRADLLDRLELYRPPSGASGIPGIEFAGEVAETGSRVDGFLRRYR